MIIVNIIITYYWETGCYTKETQYNILSPSLGSSHPTCMTMSQNWNSPA